MRVPVILAVTAVLLTASVASASPVGIHGRGLQAEAAMLAAQLGRGKEVQVLSGLCAKPLAEKRCVPLADNLRRAIARLSERPIRWVSHPHGHAGRFFVLAPVRMGASTAVTEYAWRQLRRYGCFGGATMTYTWASGTWSPSTGFAYEGCPAR